MTRWTIFLFMTTFLILGQPSYEQTTYTTKTKYPTVKSVAGKYKTYNRKLVLKRNGKYVFKLKPPHGEHYFTSRGNWELLNDTVIFKWEKSSRRFIANENELIEIDSTGKTIDHFRKKKFNKEMKQ